MAILIAAYLLKSIPVIVFSFVVQLLSACMITTYLLSRKTRRIQNPFGTSRDTLIRVLINGGFHALLMLLWSKGLQECGALRTVLLDYSGSCVANFLAQVSNKPNEANASRAPSSHMNINSLRLRGDALVAIGYLVLLYQQAEESNSENSSEILDEIGLAWGMVLLLFVSLLNAVKKRFSLKIAKDSGLSITEVSSLSLSVGTVILSPLVLLDLVGEAVIGADYDYSLLSLDILVMFFFVGLFSSFHFDLPATKFENEVLRVVSMVVSFLFAVLIYFGVRPDKLGGYRDRNVSIVSLTFCFVLCVVGFAIPVSARIVNDADFVAASSPSPHSRRSIFVSFLRSILRAFKRLTNDRDLVLPTKKGGMVNDRKYITLRVRSFLHAVLSNPESKKIFLFLCLNFAFMLVEIIVGLWTNSLGLISDAGHMFFDCTALFLGLFASVVSYWPADWKYSYGYSRIQVLSGFVNALFLIFIALFVFTESLERISEPPELENRGLLATSIGGFFVNLIGLVFFHEHAHFDSTDHGVKSHSMENTDHHEIHGHSHHNHSHGHEEETFCNSSNTSARFFEHSHSHGDENMKGVFLHILADLLGSIGVVVSSLLIEYKGWLIADPICSLMISLLIVGSAFPLLLSTTEVLLLKAPEDKLAHFNNCLRRIHSMEHVVAIIQPHFWKNSSKVFVASFYVIVREQTKSQEILFAAQKLVGEISNTQCVIQVCSSEAWRRLLELRQHSDVSPRYYTKWDPYTCEIKVVLLPDVKGTQGVYG